MIKWRRMKCVGHVAQMGEKRNANMFLVGNPDRERPLGRPSYRWKDKIIMHLK
jgi:hypothetical protein